MIAKFTLGEEHKSVRMQIQFEDDCHVGEAWIEEWCHQAEEWKSTGRTVAIYLHELAPVTAFAGQLDRQARADRGEGTDVR